MNRFTQICTLLVGILMLVACEKEIPFKGEIAQPKLVLNGNFSPDSTWSLHLSHSLSIGDTGQLRPVTNGVLRIKDENGQVLTTLDHDSAGIYTSAIARPISGKTYFVEAEAPGYTAISANDLVPAPINMRFVDSMSTSFLGQKVLSVNLQVNDPAGVENYYVFDAQVYLYDQDDFLIDAFNLYNFSLDATIDQNGIGDENSSFERLYLPDTRFDGQAYTMNMLVPTDILQYVFIDPSSSIDRVELKVRGRSVSKPLYQYLRSYDKYLNYSFDPTFSQPVQVFSNVENGFGIFGGYSGASFTFSY